LSDSEPIVFRPRSGAGPEGKSAPGGAVIGAQTSSGSRREPAVTVFDRRELSAIFAVYGRKVAAGEWRDYALDFGREKAVFSVYRRSSEWPLYRIEKNPKNARKQGTYSVISATGLILKRGHELERVLEVLEKRTLYVIKG
jgi:hypothetical protein